MEADLTIVGLGPGSPELVSRRAWKLLTGSKVVYFRTGHHPVLDALSPQGGLNTFDHLYEEIDDFEGVYTAIVNKILDEVRGNPPVIYAVPGDPMIGEATVSALLRLTSAENLSVRVLHGISFVEPCLGLLGIDALDGLSIYDALEIAGRYHPPFPPDTPVLVGQLYSKLVAADVKLTLMNQYPPEHPASLLHMAGTDDGWKEDLPLAEIDHSGSIGYMTTLFLPELPLESAFENFQETVAHLRAPDGCPWDIKQTHQSLRNHLMEEAYEALQALDTEDMDALQEELGDLLLQIVLHAQIATEEGFFTTSDVIASIQSKIIRRHPHVFADQDVEDVDQVLLNWEALKEAERENDGSGKGILDGVPIDLPALTQAEEIQARVARVGFDWPHIDGVLEKLEEELAEVQEAVEDDHVASEVGDLLFAVVNYARWKGVDPEAALREASRRFRRRFTDVEKQARVAERKLSELTIDELEELWQAAKKRS
ncbi:MAG: nucleoside triphosphate pyrophosphohydrolase [Anaerolineales bacterium]